MLLWESDNHDAKVIGLLIDEPKKLTREQAEEQVEGVAAGSLEHVFSSCDATLAKAPFVFDLACEWIASEDSVRCRCGYGLIYELSKNRRNKQLTDEFFLSCIDRIRERFGQEDTWGRISMGGALLGNGNCEHFDVAKHLTSDYLKKKLGV